MFCECVFLHVSTTALRIHNHTVLSTSHNSSSVYANDSAYTNISATVGEDKEKTVSWFTQFEMCRDKIQ